ncbi:hypothetical protein BHE90_012411, partial [Fusarium euwallaceae]
ARDPTRNQDWGAGVEFPCNTAATIAADIRRRRRQRTSSKREMECRAGLTDGD